MTLIPFIIFCLAPAALVAYAIFMFRENKTIQSAEVRKRALISGAVGIGLVLLMFAMF